MATAGSCAASACCLSPDMGVYAVFIDWSRVSLLGTRPTVDAEFDGAAHAARTVRNGQAGHKYKTSKCGSLDVMHTNMFQHKYALA